MKELTSLLDSLEISKVSLLSIEARRLNDLPKTKTGELKDSLRTNIRRREKGSFDIEVAYSLHAYYKNEEIITPIFVIKLKYLISYSTKYPETPRMATLKMIKNKTAVLNIWPYLRHQIYLTTGEMGVPPLLIKTLASK